MKTLFYFGFILTISVVLARAEGPVDTAANVAHDTVDTAKNVGHKVVRGTKRVVHRVADAITPESDARRVDVTVSDDRIDMPARVGSGKTAFVVRNTGHRTHNFEVDGDAGDYEFQNAVRPQQTKVLHVPLTRGTYSVRSWSADKQKQAANTTVTVR